MLKVHKLSTATHFALDFGQESLELVESLVRQGQAAGARTTQRGVQVPAGTRTRVDRSTTLLRTSHHRPFLH